MAVAMVEISFIIILMIVAAVAVCRIVVELFAGLGRW